MDSKSVGLGWRELVTANTTDSWIPATSWGFAAGLGNARSRMEMRGRFGSFSAVPAYQTANDVLNPDAAIALPVLVGGNPGYANADGVYFLVSTPASLVVADKVSIRFGWIIKVSGGTGGAGVSGVIDLLY